MRDVHAPVPLFSAPLTAPVRQPRLCRCILHVGDRAVEGNQLGALAVLALHSRARPCGRSCDVWDFSGCANEFRGIIQKSWRGVLGQRTE